MKLRERFPLVLVGCLAIAMTAIFWHHTRTHENALRTAALLEASGRVDVLRELRSLYASEVVARVQGHGIEISHDYAGRAAAIPLPATLTMLIGERVSESHRGGAARLYSPYPFPWRGESGGLRDEFERSAWEQLVKDPDHPIFQFDATPDGPLLRYAVADRLEADCVECHNTHPLTPKNDWSTGDVRGVLEVRVPLSVENNLAALGNSLGLMGLLVLVGALFFWIITANLRRDSRTLTTRVTEGIAERARLVGDREQGLHLEAIGRLAAGIAHEINTPTQFVGDNTRFLEESFSQLVPLLERSEALTEAVRQGRAEPEAANELRAAFESADFEYLAEEIPKAIGESLAGLDRVRRIVQSMKEFSHPDVEEMTPIDLNRAIETTIIVCRNEWKYVAEVETALDPDLPLVDCFPGKINQVIMNLIVNAAHAIQEGTGGGDRGKGKITISTRQDGEFAEVKIADTGAGIPVDARSRIFDPFFTTKELGRGTGQGLAISHSVVVKKHGGALAFESEVAVGTTFSVRLPISRERVGVTTC